jgi:hypothetical protein
MTQPTNSSRKKFLLWGAAIFSSVTALKIFSGSKNTANKNDENAGTVKMLTQDGKLVEVDKKLLAAGSNKISDEELQKWISKK